ncbi:hypothetical protein DL96DRAFT_598192 [Flagelloscypha sp. PMI_526]|nr:hypothetical protein DL96DRAFT_598192 [Flagelloscypha sp. PMI_526]
MDNTAQSWAERAADVDYYGTVALMAESLFFGMFVIIFGISIILLVQQRKTMSAPRKILFSSILFIGMAMTTDFSLALAGTLIQMSWPHLLGPSATLHEKLIAADELSLLPYAGTWVVIPLVYIVADAMPIWRAYILWSHSKVMKTILLVLYGVNVSVCLLQAIFLTVDELKDKNGDNEVRQSIIYATSLLVSVAVNAISTSLIGYQVWRHRNNMKESSQHSSLSIQLLVLVIEAGLALCIVQIINASISITSSFDRSTEPLDALSLSATVWTPFGDSFAASYPSLIVIITAGRHSVLDTMLPQDGEDGENTMPPIQFAPSSTSNQVTLGSINPENSFKKSHLTTGSEGGGGIEMI